jgi:hypothetical protein
MLRDHVLSHRIRVRSLKPIYNEHQIYFITWNGHSQVKNYNTNARTK